MDTLTPIHDELDYILEVINESIEMSAEFAVIRLEEMVLEADYVQQSRMYMWEWEQELMYG